MNLTARIAKDSLPLTIIGLGGRGATMVIPLVIARWFGADQITDAFYLAIAFPMFAEAILASALHAAFGPRYAEARSEGNGAAARLLGHSVLVFLLLLTFTSIAMYGLAPLVLEAMAGFRDPNTVEMATSLMPPLLATIPLVGMNVLLTSALEVSGFFLIPALLPLFKVTAYMGVIAALVDDGGAFSLPMGYFAGELVQSLWLGVGMVYARIPVSVRRPFRPATKGLMLIFAPLALGDLAIHVNAFVDRAMAAGLAHGDLTVLEYADRLRVIPEAVVTVGLLRVTFSHWSNQNVLGNIAAIRTSFRQVVRWLVIILVPGSTALMLLRRPVAAILLGGRSYGPEAVEATARTLIGYIPGIPFLMLSMVALHILWINARTKQVAIVGLVSTATNLALNYVLVGRYGTLGLAWSTSINQAMTAVVLLYMASKLLSPLLSMRFWAMAVAVGVANVGWGWALRQWVGLPTQDWQSDIGSIVAILALIGAEVVGLAVVGGHLRHFAVPDPDDLGPPGPVGDTETVTESPASVPSSPALP